MYLEGYRTCVFDRILSHRQNQYGRYQFLVKWKKSASSWESIQNLCSVSHIVQKYLRENTIKCHSWSKGNIKNDKDKGSTKIIQQGYEDQNTCATNRDRQPFKSTDQMKNNQDLILRYDDYFEPDILLPSQRYPKKITTSDQLFNKAQKINKKVQWNDIKKALNIKYDENQQKYKVLIQFYDQTKEKIWIDRDLMRICNPFLLLDLYTRIDRCRIQNRQYDQKSQINQQNQLEVNRSGKRNRNFVKRNLQKDIQISKFIEEIVIEDSTQEIDVIELE